MKFPPSRHHLRLNYVDALKIDAISSGELRRRLLVEDTSLSNFEGLGLESTFALQELESSGIQPHLSMLCTPCMTKR